MIRNILVPLDCSTFGEHAIPWALSLARRTEARVHLAHVLLPASMAYARLSSNLIEPYTDTVRRQGKTYLEGMIQQLEEFSSVPLTTTLLEGDESERICHYASEIAADLVVMTTHGRGAFGRFWLGSVADRMVRQSDRPLFMVRPGLTPLDLQQDFEIRHALVPLDGERLAESILPHVVPLCRAWGSELHLLRVVEPLHIRLEHQMMAGLAPSAPPLATELKKLESQHRQEAEDYLEEVAGRLQGQRLAVHPSTVVNGSIAEAILEEADDLSIDLIAIGTHARRGLSRLFLGSTADKVIRGTTNPVLVHRPEIE